MASRGYKKVITLGLDYSDFQGGITEVNRQIRVLDAEFRNASTKAKEFGNSTDQLGLKQEQLSQKVILQTQKVDLLKKKYEESAKTNGENTKATDNARIAYKNAETELIKLEAALEEVNKQVSGSTNMFSDVANKMDNFVLKTEQNNIKLQEVGRGLSTIGGALTAGITVPLVGMATIGTKASAEFETAFTGVKKTVEGTEEQFAALEKGIINMSRKIPSTAVEIAGVAEAAGQLGIQTENILDFTKVMIDLGNATNMSANDAATSLARFANITRMSQSDFDRLGATIVALGNNLATTESEIASMAQRLAGAGSQIGLTEAQILGFAGALSSVGIEAEAGGSAFSKVFINMQLAVEKGGDELRNFANVAGMSTARFKKVFEEDASMAVLKFIEGLGNMENRGKSTIGVLDEMGITEIRLRDSLLRAAGAGDLFAQSIETGTKAWEENIALTEEADQRYGTFESKLQMFKNGLSAVAKLIGDIVKPVIEDLLDALTPFIYILSIIFEVISKLPAPLQKLIVIFGILLAAIGPILLIVGKMLSSFVDMSSKLKDVGTAIDTVRVFFTGLNPQMLKTVATIMLVVAALIALGTIIAVLIGRSSQMQDAFASMSSSISSLTAPTLQTPQIPTLPNYATGGSVKKGQIFQVNENGGEIQVADSNRIIIPHDLSKQLIDNMSMNGSGGDTYNINLYVDVSSIDDVRDIVQMAKNARQNARAGIVLNGA